MRLPTNAGNGKGQTGGGAFEAFRFSLLTAAASSESESRHSLPYCDAAFYGNEVADAAAKDARGHRGTTTKEEKEEDILLCDCYAAAEIPFIADGNCLPASLLLLLSYRIVASEFRGLGTAQFHSLLSNIHPCGSIRTVVVTDTALALSKG